MVLLPCFFFNKGNGRLHFSWSFALLSMFAWADELCKELMGRIFLHIYAENWCRTRWTLLIKRNRQSPGSNQWRWDAWVWLVNYVPGTLNPTLTQSCFAAVFPLALSSGTCAPSETPPRLTPMTRTCDIMDPRTAWLKPLHNPLHVDPPRRWKWFWGSTTSLILHYKATRPHSLSVWLTYSNV